MWLNLQMPTVYQPTCVLFGGFPKSRTQEKNVVYLADKYDKCEKVGKVRWGRKKNQNNSVFFEGVKEGVTGPQFWWGPSECSSEFSHGGKRKLGHLSTDSRPFSVGKAVPENLLSCIPCCPAHLWHWRNTLGREEESHSRHWKWKADNTDNCPVGKLRGLRGMLGNVCWANPKAAPQ